MSCGLSKLCLALFWYFTISAIHHNTANGRNTHEPKTVDENITAHVYLDETVGNISHFWKSTGFCPPSPHNMAWRWFDSESMQQNLLYIGALPFGAIEQVRMHWLLDLITVTSLHAGIPIYNMILLDKLLDRLHNSRLQPGFELMGNPGGMFTDMEDPIQVMRWRHLVHTVAVHYIDRYGLAYVSSWNFETWNEPKVGHFGNLNITIKGFLNYYDACAAGLKLAGQRLRLGGPGGECKKYQRDHYCWALLDHIHNGQDYFTSQMPYTPDYISIHKKGEVPDNTKWILRREEETINEIHSHFPKLANISIFNDEGDPIVGWSNPKPWRADSTYAAMVTKVVVQHHRKWFGNHSKIKFGLLSNDNGFLSYKPINFEERTLLARFQVNDTVEPRVEMVAKPAYTVMGLLAYLGQSERKVNLYDINKSIEQSVGVLATYRNATFTDSHQSAEWSILLYNSNDTYNSSTAVNVNLTFNTRQLLSEGMITIYQLDEFNGNPYKKWINMGCPSVPSRDQFAALRYEEVVPRVYGPTLFAAYKPIQIQLPHPAVALVHICAKPDQPPQAVTSVSIHVISKVQALVTWDASSITTRCLLTYLVYFSAFGQRDSYRRIDHPYTVFNYIITEAINGSFNGYYKVRAVDVWYRKGHSSSPIILT